MDMSKLNEDILKAEDEVDLGPRFPDGDYVMSVTNHDEKHGDYEQDDKGEWPQLGFYVTFLICEGEQKGKEHRQYFNIKHPTSDLCQKFGRRDLKQFYKAINFVPTNFTDVYGKRFKATLESEKSDDPSYPWQTRIVKWATAPAAQGQSFQDTVAQTHATKPEDEIPF